MIAASDPQEFVPCGRQQVKRHPGEVVLPSIQPQLQAESLLLHRFSQVAITESTPKEWWTLRASPSGEEDCEDELYVCGKTTVWSRGAAADNTSESGYSSLVLNCHTTETPVHHALWSTFCSYRTECEDPSSESFKVDPYPCLCIVDSSNINIYTQEGEDFITSLPFQVQNVRSTRYGLLLERTLSGGTSDGLSSLPILFALLNPLHEISPVLTKQSSVAYVTDSCQKLVFTNEEDPCICMFYNSKTGLHSVWKIRKATFEECKLMCGNYDETFGQSQCSMNQTPALIFSGSQRHQSALSPSLLAQETLFSTSGASCEAANPGHISNCHSCSYLSATSNLSDSSFLLNPIQSQTTNPHQPSLTLGNRLSGLVPSQRGGACRSHSSSPQLHRSHSPITFLSSRQQTSSPLRNCLLGRSSRHQTSQSWLGASSFHSGFAHLSPLSGNTPSNSGIGNLSASITPPSDSRLLSLPPPAAFSNDVDSRPLIPELCLEHIWTENHGLPREKAGLEGATKVFLATDLVGQHFLCYLIGSQSILYCARIIESSTSDLIFGSITSIVAKDACSLQKLRITVTVDLSGGVVLYSGVTMVGKVQVGGVPSALANSSCFSRSLGNQFALSPFTRYFDRRKSLLASSRPTSALEVHFEDDLNFLSPVRPTSPPSSTKISTKDRLLSPSFFLSTSERKTGILSNDEHMDDVKISWKPSSDGVVQLRDPVGSRVTLEYTNGPLFRITLPELCSSPLVTDCLNTLKQVLQRDIAMQVIVKWYGVRNAPGSQDISPKVEWELFIGVLLGLVGYNVEKLPFMHQYENESYSSPATLPKKQKTSDSGSSEDWDYLLNYCTEKRLGPVLNSMGFHLPSVANVMEDGGEIGGKAEEACAQINSSAVLYPYIPMILFALHLQYEDLKLNTLRWDMLPMLAQLLHQLAIDLRQENYVDHYWRDFPMHCPLRSLQESQVTVDDLLKLSNPGVIPTEPPSIFSTLHLIYQRKKVPPFPYINQVNNKTKDIIMLTALLSYGSTNPSINVDDFVNQIVPPGSRAVHTETASKASLQNSQIPYQYKAVLILAEKGFTEANICLLPAGVALPIHQAILHCRHDPPPNWPSSAYKLIMRKDLAMQFKPPATMSSKQMSQLASKLIGPDADSKVGTTPAGSGIAGVGSSSTNNGVSAPSTQGPDTRKTSHSPDGIEDGMEGMDMEVLKLRFSKDHRVAEARRLLQSSQPVTIAITQRPDVSDHEFIEEQERHLYALCTRTMALPVGRGMFTLRTASPVVTEPLPIPRLCLTGRAPPRGATVDLSHIETAPNMSLWSLFHNGVAAGLRIVPEASGIQSAWIVYNKPRGNSDIEHAGFLMALGLNGHLSNLAVLSTYDYLSKIHEMTSVGILLGIGAAKRGTMDMATTKMLSVHVEALLPPTSIELDLPQNVQVAALIGVGLVYQGTAHRHIAEVLLSEIGRPPGPEMDNCFDRESFSLAAGLALGHVVLGLGTSESGDGKSLTSGGLADLHIPDTLHYYMVGGHRRPLTGAQKEKYKTPSYQIREGDSVNIDVTSPGATLALGMMYFNSGNRAVADWMKAADTQYLLDFVRPDFLILRTVARGLILWNEVYPTSNWIESQIPESIKHYCLRKPPENEDGDIDYETMNQVYCNIMAGACMAVGLKFAGSANEEAFRTLLFYAKMFTSLTIKSISELVGKSTIETCLNVIVLSLAMIMAGTGNLEVIRLCRHLRSRVGPSSSSSGASGAAGAAGAAGTGGAAAGSAGGAAGSGGGTNSNSVVTYGSHLAIHMALGLLFLGGGRYTLSTSPPAIAALLCAFFPKFPTHSNDNRNGHDMTLYCGENKLIWSRKREFGQYISIPVGTLLYPSNIDLDNITLFIYEYHLQALRHLYVLAVEPRLLLPRDINTGKICYAHLTLVFLDTPHYRHQRITNLKAPCLLPELNLLKEVRIEDERYWSIIFYKDRNWDQLQNMLKNMRGLFVQQKAGCLSYIEDPHGFQSLLAQTLTSNTANCWSIPAESVFAFSSDSSIVTFVQYFLRQGKQFFFKGQKVGSGYINQSSAPLNQRREEDELKLMQFMATIVYEQVTQDKPGFLQLWIMFFMALQSLKSNGSSMLAWQLKLLSAHVLSRAPSTDSVPLITTELALSVMQQVDTILESYKKEVNLLLKKYYFKTLNGKESFVDKLTLSLILYDLPSASKITEINNVAKDPLSLYRILHKLHIPPGTCLRLSEILK